MSRLPSRFARGPRRVVASHPARAGFRPAAAAIAVAAAFGLQTAPLRAQPVGGQAIAGQASFVRDGSNLLVTTQNAPGSNHSAINWQSFSVPAGSVTQFNQPSVTSTSINRVLGPDPSAIFGTLTSNGRLVLVNPAGIAVGQGAVVDTAGFTASTLAMSEADAIAGRMRFAGNGGALQVDGTIVARSGDVVLVAPDVRTGADALVQSANGATVLAAGQKVEITGRGLEGIRMEVQAPQDQALNLGTLQGDAVGIFAGTLKHSGLVQAHAVTAEGGKVLLRALGENLVSGTIQARDARGHGGSIDVLGERVGLLAGAALDVRGAYGGGQVRVGGDYQGSNSEVPNARRTYFDTDASIRADALLQGDGGRVIVWSDEATRMHGRISARGGPLGGDGGFAEVSGKQWLDFTGRADLRAPQGRSGTLLLDPNDIDIVPAGTVSGNPSPQSGAEFSGGSGTTTVDAGVLSTQLGSGGVLVKTSGGSAGAAGGMIHLLSGASVNWASGSTLWLDANTGIQLDGTINGSTFGVANGGLTLITQTGDIKQGAGSSITVDRLFAQAGQFAGAAGTGGRVLLDQGASNHVGTLAGKAYGPGSEFRFTNNESLTVGLVGDDNGIIADDGTNRGTVTLIANNGALKVNDGAAILGGSIILTANSAADGDLVIGTTSINANGGGMALTAGRDFGFANTVGTSSYPQLYATGDLSINTGRNVAIGQRTGSTSYIGTYVQSGQKLSITAGQDINIGASAPETYPGYVWLYGGTGPLGGVVIDAGGSVDFGGYGSVNAYQGPIDITAGGSILGNGSFTTHGGPDGWVHLTATTSATGSISFNTINSSGSFSGIAGGEVKLLAKGDVAGNNIYASGAYSYGGTTPGGTGGTITITSDNGGISLGKKSGSSITVSGGAMVAGGYGYSLASGGQGGAITLSAPNGNILVTGSLNADGGFSQGGTGGDALYNTNAITVIGQTVDIASLQASGGSTSLGAGGHGGAITVQSSGQLGLGSAFARGGNATLGSAGGGTGGSLLLISGGTVSASQVDASGGWGPGGGDGGSATILGVDVSIPFVAARGGGQDDGVNYATAGSGNGGHGGAVVVEFQGILAGGSFDASGANGRNGTPEAPNGGRGGNGGLAAVTRTGGDFALDALTLAAQGGTGGNADRSSSTNTGGAGGDGGMVMAFAAAGSLSTSGGTFSAAAGQGGYHADGSTRAPGGAVLGTVAFLASDNLDLSGANLNLGAANLAGHAGGNVDLWERVVSHGGTVTLSAGDATLATPLAGAALNVHAPIDTTDGGSVPGGAITLLAQGNVLLDPVEPVPSLVPAGAITGGPVLVKSGATLQLLQAIVSDAFGDAVVLAANNFDAGPNAAIQTPNGRWLVYLAGPDGNNFGSLASGNFPLWNRTFESSPPGTVSEPGNRYLFAYQPLVDIQAKATTKVYDGTPIDIDLGYTHSPLVDAAAYGNVFLQDVFTGSLQAPATSKNVGSYTIGLGTLGVAGYGVRSFTGNVATITPRPLHVTATAASREYDATTNATVSLGDDRIAGDSLAASGSGSFADKNVGTGKSVSVTGIGLTGVDAGNYALANASASTSADITPAPVNVTADDQAKAQGTTLVFNGTEFSASGLKGGETIASVSLSSPGTPADAPVGVYAITPSAAVGANGFLAGNYAITYLNGALLVGSPVEQQQVLNQVVTFATLFFQEAKAQDALDKKKTDFGKDDIVITDASCKPL